MQPQPHLIRVPDNNGLNRIRIWHRPPGYGSDALLGHVHETAGAGVVATWTDEEGNELVGMPGFDSIDRAAEALYWFDPPMQSIRSRAAMEPADTWVNGSIHFRATDTEGAVTAIQRAASVLLDDAGPWKDAGETYDVRLVARNTH
ncbi:hypothetical protein [Streptomyces sp. NPDC001089]